MSKITLSFMQRFMGNLDRAIRDYVSSKLSTIDTHIGEVVDEKIEDAMSSVDEYIDEAVAQKQDKPIIMHQTMNVGTTTVTFTELPTTGFNMLDIYTSIADIDYVELDDSTAGQLTVTYEAQEVDVEIFLRIEVAPNESV